MIKINLITGKKKGGLTSIGGVDFNKLNIKMIIVAILFLYIPESFLVDMWDGEIEVVRQKNASLRKEYSKINKQVRSMKAIEEQVAALKAQETKLAKKLVVVKQIINKRQNPFQVFYYLAQNIPPDVWLTRLELDDKRLVLTGHSKTWKSIGKFLENIKSSIFFSKDLQYQQPPGADKGKERIESFMIVANIARFE